MITHYDCDYGTLDAILGKNKSGRKTTLCGKNVTYAQIDNAAPTCPDCQRKYAETMALAEILKEA